MKVVKIIKTEKENEKALREIEKLMAKPKLTKAEDDYLELLFVGRGFLFGGMRGTPNSPRRAGRWFGGKQKDAARWRHLRLFAYLSVCDTTNRTRGL